MRRLAVMLLGLLMLANVGAAEAAGPGGEGAPYPEVRPGRSFSFPADLGAHPTYRTEWWYATGWLEDETGQARGFQVTFFRVRSRIGEGSASRFAPSQLIIAHVALADAAQGRLLHAERSARAQPPLAGAEEGRTHAWIGDWRFSFEDGRYRAIARDPAFGIDLELHPEGAPLLNGEGGYSRKAPAPEHASYYYSRPQLRVAGEIIIAGERRTVKGHAWLDHEWSSQVMPAEAAGWDWVGLNLLDGGAVMAFQMRDRSGKPLWAAATVREVGGEAHRLPPQAVSFQPGRRWLSPRTGAEYPVEWSISLQLPGGRRRLDLRPLMDDQELDGRRSTGAVYWEGAVSVTQEDGTALGHGYLEMTGYANRPRL
ncbi:lipocalin-like domain-containing protein [Azoarcus indigens]|uniref:Putative secreted hydrolase n=1 Tax=Azoarcus indigens TaxID=29545 RepID=A0A4V3BP09_9RHOO|nr:carotenoid 1,2-hydratase [Azoarcus indigens]TDN55702.1 putative secreted hydrolase [Azoarcus indigens]